jgi:aminotransferase
MDATPNRAALTVSRRVEGLAQSEIRAMTRACVAVGGINMGQGICDVPPEALLKEAARQAIDGDISQYTRFDGEERLRLALQHKFKAFNRLDFRADGEICVTLGASGAYACALTALFNAGDEILIFEPFYGYHWNTALVAGLTPIPVPLAPPDFAFTLEALERRVTPRTRAILVNTPTNPSGKVFSTDELSLIADLCHARGLICLTDEVYEHLVFDAPHVSIATLPGMRDRTVTIGSYSKTFSITGWRIGYAAAPEALSRPIGLVNDLYYNCAPAPLQRAVAVGIETLPDAYYEGLRQTYRRKRDLFCDVLRESGLEPIVPAGAYYVLADTSRFGVATSKEAAMRLLHEAGIAAIPGSAFYTGPTGERLLRFCVAKGDGDLAQACERIRDWARRSA